MKVFPEHFTPDRLSEAPARLFYRNLAYMRKEIYEFTISRKLGDFETYMTLDEWKNVFGPQYKQAMDIILKELRSKNWKADLVYGDSGLAIWDTEEHTPECVSKFSEVEINAQQSES